MSEPRDWDLLARYLAGEATAEEESEIRAWIASDPENREMVNQLKVSFSVTDMADQDIDVNRLWEGIAQEIGRSKYGLSRAGLFSRLADRIKRSLPPRPVLAFRPAMLATAVALALVAMVWIPYQYTWESSPMVEVNVVWGERRKIELSDGTSVTLDAGSQLVYPEEFENDLRRVSLRGEAYFQVTADDSRPFVVGASPGEIQVVGTAFNVRNWESDGSVEVAVEEGRVRFGRAGSGAEESVILEASQVSTLGETAPPSAPKSIDIGRQLAWLRDEVFYEDAAVSEILDRLRRWHNVEFVVTDSAILHEHLTLHLTKSSLENSLALLSRLTGSTITQIEGRYHLVPRTTSGL